MDSSPLAALHPAPIQPWGRDPLNSMAGAKDFGAGTFNIRERLQQTKPDYFSMRRPSPSTLAADMSQNWRIDSESSPKFPTPRRALFTSAAFGGDTRVTTPPMPASSSPVPMSGDMMDISPLPHKGPLMTTIEVTSTPTPGEPTLDESMMSDSPIPMSRQGSFTYEQPAVAPEPRKRIALRRPSLSRSKVHSTSALLTRLHPESQTANFRFGPETRFGGALDMSPGECFQDSPPQPQEKRPQTANSPSASGPIFRPKPQFASLTGTRDIRNGSPLASHSRRPSNPFNRPRRAYRRTLSMFENPGEVVKQKSEEPQPQSNLQSVMDVEEIQDPILPHFFGKDQNDSIPRISRETFVDILDGKYADQYQQKVVIDCRFEYEYDGGHIDGAINYNDKELLAKQLFHTPMEGKTLLIFHCEYSAHRAPMMARHVRSEDRTINAEFYPKLSYPEVYILDGGYSEFYNEHRNLCYPQAYVEMHDSEHVFTCERELGKLQQKRKGLNRAKTFAFGHRQAMTESPTAPGRLGSHQSPCGMLGASPMLGGSPMLGHSPMLGNSPILGADRSPARRMASY